MRRVIVGFTLALPFIFSSITESWARSTAIRIETDLGAMCGSTLRRPWPHGNLHTFRTSKGSMVGERGLRASQVPHLNSWFYQPTPVFTREEQDMRALVDIEMELWHGFGAEYSHAEAMITPLRIFSDRANGLWTRVKNFATRRNWASVWASAPDLPYSGNGPQDWIDLPFSEQIERMANYLRWRKSLNPTKPLVVLGRSASTGLILQVNYDYPGLIDGIVLIAPVHPTPEHGWDEGNRRLQAMIDSKVITPNEPAIAWIKSLYPQMTWQHDSNFTRETPTLVLFGGKDEETPASTRIWFESQQDPNLYTEFFPEGKHDLLQIWPKNDASFDGTQVFVRIHKFFREKVMKR